MIVSGSFLVPTCLLTWLFLVWNFRVGGKSSVDDYTLAAEACLPIFRAILAEIKNTSYPLNGFLNIDLPTDIANHKVYFKLDGNISIFCASIVA